MIENIRDLGSDYYLLELNCPEIAKHARPGHFVNVRITGVQFVILRRPLAVFDVVGNTVKLFMKVAGKGTQWMSGCRPGMELDIVGPLGKGLFEINFAKRIILVAGGVGLAPLYYFLTYNKNKNVEKILFYGARKSDYVYFQNELISLTDKCYFVTEDGSLGEKGMVNEELRKFFLLSEPRSDDLIMTCGPNPMIKEIVKFAHSEKISCQVSLESYMGCGTGVCLSCVVPSRDTLDDGEKYFQVCCEGPVVDSKRIDESFFDKK